MLNAWKKIKRSGSYYRNQIKQREAFMKRAFEIRSELMRSRVVRPSIPVQQPLSIINCQQQQIIGCNYSQQPTENTSHIYLNNSSNENATATSSGVFTRYIWVRLLSFRLWNMHSLRDLFSEYIGMSGVADDEQMSECSDFSAFISDADAADDDDDVEDDEITRNINFRGDLRKWAVEHSIKHTALKGLMKILNERFGNKCGESNNLLPDDPRTLLQTPQTVSILPLSSGSEYWHHGLANCLKHIFPTLDEPMTISLTINMDGLPLFNSSRLEFWPILFNIAEMPQVSPMVIGILSGKSKTKDLELFFAPFVEEMHDLMTNGLYIDSNKITVKIRCFICDSPARAYVKGK